MMYDYLRLSFQPTEGTLLPQHRQSISYTAFNKASHISQGTKDYFIIYPDRLRRCTSHTADNLPGVWNRPSEISIETLAEAKCGGLVLSDPCLRSAATSFGPRGFARLSVSWEISGSLDFFVLFYQEKRTMKNYCYTYSGNIITRSDVGTYGYSPTNAGSHAVTGITNATGTILPQHRQSISYNAFNKVSHISQGGKDYFIIYPDRLRCQTSLHNDMADDALMTKYYAFGDFEQETDATGTRQIHYISAGDGLAAVYVKNDGGTDSLYFIMKDHLGSITGAINKETGKVYRQSFDAWGRNRNPEDWSYTDIPEYFPLDRGYTGHEHLKRFGLINMNGRMYDAGLCRFLSPDPYVQMPDNTQNFNRYSYYLECSTGKCRPKVSLGDTRYSK